jgi:hypothetical protein
MSESVLLCISTLKENANHYSKMFTLKKADGTSMFDCTQISLVCDKCRETDHPEKSISHTPHDHVPEKLTPLHSIHCIHDCIRTQHHHYIQFVCRCTHKMADCPRWLSSSKMETVRTLLAGNQALMLRESMGMSADMASRAFREPLIVSLLERPFASFNTAPLVYIGVDPSGGGPSAYALCSLAIMPDSRIVVCLTPSQNTLPI